MQPATSPRIVQRVPVRIVLDDDGGELGKLRPGLSVVVHVDERKKTGDRVNERHGPSVRDDGGKGSPVRDDEGPDTSIRDARQ
jgi:hypothetical protein